VGVYQMSVAACSGIVARQAEASRQPSGEASSANTSYPCPYNLCVSGHSVFCINVSSVGGAAEPYPIFNGINPYILTCQGLHDHKFVVVTTAFKLLMNCNSRFDCS
jgi:hypothetical protein